VAGAEAELAGQYAEEDRVISCVHAAQQREGASKRGGRGCSGLGLATSLAAWDREKRFAAWDPEKRLGREQLEHHRRLMQSPQGCTAGAHGHQRRHTFADQAGSS
jgi:hypothetical protein